MPSRKSASRATASIPAGLRTGSVMRDWLAAQAESCPKNTALVYQGKVWSFAELNRQVDVLCSRLAGLHIPRDAFVALHLPDSPDYVLLIHALARLGMRLAALNTRLTAEELASQLERLDCVWLLGDGSEKLAKLESPSRRILNLDELKSLPTVEFEAQPLGLKRIQGVIFTSGTSGAAKGALLTFGNHFWNAIGSAARLGMLPIDRWLNPLPLYHVGGQAAVFRCCLFGATLVLPGSFDLAEMRRSLQEDDISLVSLVPTMLYRLLPQVDWEGGKLRTVLLGGAAAPPELLSQVLAAGVPVALSYGLTEAASQVATTHPADTRRKPGSVGKGLLYTRIRVVDDQDGDLLPGEIGEILVAGPTVMAGYFGDSPASEHALRNGWLHTGDLGYLDADGDLWPVQRRSDLILCGGENVYPVEVESVLRQHPAVADVCVVGVPDIEWGQRVAAMVALLPGKEIKPEDMLEFCRERLAGYKQPRLLRLVAGLPQTASGKVDRKRVQAALAEAEQGEV